MIDGLKPYPAYRDTRLPWLGELPSHWEVKRMKAEAANVVEETAERQSGELYLALEHVEGWTGRLRDAGSQILFESQVKRFRAGDVLFGKLRPYLAKVTRPTRSGVCVGEFLVLRPRGLSVDATYLERLLRSKPIIDVINSSTFGAKMPRADWQFIGNLRLPFPSLSEQSSIARFLYHADLSIRRYVRAKRKLMALLNEQKQLLIHRAVTRGLNPNARLKLSGLQWVGEMPEHWLTRRAKQLFREVDSRSTTGTERLLSLRMHRGLLPHDEVSSTPIPAEALVGFKKVSPGQIVMNRMRAAIGMFGVASQAGLVSPDYAVFEPNDLVDANFFLHLFRTRAAGTVFRFESKGLGTGSSGFMRLYTDRFGNIKLPCPPREEQEMIVRGIERETADLQRMLDRIAREVGLVEEYRTRLIADVITGKLDVREAAARLPEESSDVEPLPDEETSGETEDAMVADVDSPAEAAEA